MLTTDLRTHLSRVITKRSGEIRFDQRVLEAMSDPYAETEDTLIDKIDRDLGRERLARGRTLGRQTARFDLYYDVVLPRRQFRATLAK